MLGREDKLDVLCVLSESGPPPFPYCGHCVILDRKGECQSSSACMGKSGRPVADTVEEPKERRNQKKHTDKLLEMTKVFASTLAAERLGNSQAVDCGHSAEKSSCYCVKTMTGDKTPACRGSLCHSTVTGALRITDIFVERPKLQASCLASCEPILLVKAVATLCH